ncbi:Putative sterigmatocystin biosynthesis peroxidase stcC [Fulvia fulva]|uniref:Sterigmatocystin biosynthesis peroxidase stcC n=1 Tax=Passalora fulva TaxID=5499 RepID=A0A9Q8PGB3_PASFU|nr:Putative sterigmatocystin biosynthesis peroxidase stcC [Fulvia fulva]KAK4613679.1 putative sterigmatocystin biosynthesis peroxidase stcC [Fulvia fulva]KAK4614804.1 putative sterigmatocystin biosynthesis peroxidase stcC [Fulvia fulva]UJO21975.1 Putative sterigmatocystin biosynthesis peroxidase stcC [Fulvia fulva]WPV19843.1 Putative sterigmatocystin biosynthesis peroxidase stcC [Fulvia fulva]WPV35340.1 Putative sterigmatocystin biosynthesis peroxidase stcC [Fulvia fulva]
MQLSLITAARELLWPNTSPSKALINGEVEHEYIRGNIQDRSPCPGLNALANHGYLPRDGRGLTIAQVEEACMRGVHQSKALSSAVARPLKQIVRSDGTFDLIDLRRHNVIEHDASLTRLDARQGDNYTFQPAMLQSMFDDAHGGPVTVESLAKSYNRRKKERKADGGVAVPLDLRFVNIIQTVSFLNSADTNGKLSDDMMRVFYEEERIPEVVLNNQHTRTLIGLLGYAFKLIYFVVVGS